MKEDVSVAQLRARLVGKTVVSVEQSPLLEHYYLIGTSDGATFHIGATELGSWITDGPRKDGFFPTIKSLASAVEHVRHFSRHEVSVTVVRSGDVLLVDPGDGSTLRISSDCASDPWEKKVLSHHRAHVFLAAVLENPFLGWAHFFRRDLPPGSMAAGVVPPELLLDDQEVTARA